MFLLPLLSGFGIPLFTTLVYAPGAVLFYRTRPVSGDNPGNPPKGEPLQGYITYPLAILGKIVM